MREAFIQGRDLPYEPVTQMEGEDIWMWRLDIDDLDTAQLMGRGQ